MGILEKLKALFKGKKEEKERKEVSKVPTKEEAKEVKKEELTEEELRQEAVLPGTEHLEALEAVTEEEEVEKEEKEEKEEAIHLEEEKKEEIEIRPKIYPADPVIKAPEIGVKTARVLQSAGIDTIEELLKTPIREIQEKLAKVGKKVYRATIYRWKIETRLMMEIPILRVRDVKYLYEIRIRSREDLLKYTVDELLGKIEAFLKTKEGQKLAEKYDPPTREDIRKWLKAAKEAKEKIPEAEVVF